ncbi:hypothetical protein F0562_013057 [Nyssa sinensis]|uniref:VQ domain-containing protein n=1 Tax=Nyssa sinensis TaxID=561372 RepID=A0A5J4ZYQ3_9ASTE|nr:hypothetical protein F0562_013057 [Nyssa sinensis]
MESYKYSLSSSSSSSSSTYLSFDTQQKKPKPQSSIHSSLHSVRKLPGAKPWKKPIAPLPPTPPRIYKVDSVNFREVVQKLTAAPEFQSRRLQSVAPPPLNLSTTTFSDTVNPAPLQLAPSPNRTPLSATFRDLMTETLDTKPRKFSDSLALAAVDPLGFTYG